MSKLEQIEDEIKGLRPDELKSFRTWFTQFEAELWDRQLEADVKSGRLQSEAERALEEHSSGRSTLL